MKLWSGRFSKGTDNFVDEFTASLPVDKYLYKQDIKGSIAHANMLAACGIISREEAERIIEGLQAIKQEIEGGRFQFDIADEDIHMAIERVLTERIGATGGKLHTARSRNDQVALDTRMFLKDAIVDVGSEIMQLQLELINISQREIKTIMPGYTHLQRAQPILFSHHMMAYFWMLRRDLTRLKGCYKRTDIMPLGAAALAGTTYPIDVKQVAKELGFEKISNNSIDAVSDRDYIIEFQAVASMLMMHLSRLAEELILWSSTEFSFIELDDAYTTGSSIMPQKKNADVAELIRGKTGRVYGNLMQALAMMKGLPLAYNKDMQEDKESLLDSIDTIKKSIIGMKSMILTMKVNSEVMRQAAEGGYTNATELADYLAAKGVPFRDAHRVAGVIVSKAVEEGCWLSDFSLEELQAINPLIEDDIFKVLDIKVAVERRNNRGGTATGQVQEQIEKAIKLLEKEQEWLEERA